jgi:hypothetical protein
MLTLAFGSTTNVSRHSPNILLSAGQSGSSGGTSSQCFILTMKIDQLLQQRSSLLRQTRLANVAYVFAELRKFADRITRGNLRGKVTFHLADPEAQRAWPILVAEEGSQSVIDEHFLDYDILDLADLLVFTAGQEPPRTFTFRLEEFGRRFLPALRRELAEAGIETIEDSESPDRPLRT